MWIIKGAGHPESEISLILCKPVLSQSLQLFPNTLTFDLSPATSFGSTSNQNSLYLVLLLHSSHLVTIRYDTIEEINVDSKAEYTA